MQLIQSIKKYLPVNRVLAIIPARGGSKGIPRKNLVNLYGKPLIGWTIETAKACRAIDRIFVSTDDPEIAKFAEACGISVPWLRPAELATDSAPMLPVLIDTVKRLREAEAYFPDFVMLLQPSSPFRTAEDIYNCIMLALDRHSETVVSVSESDTHPYLCKKMDPDGIITDFMQIPQETALNRQNLPTVYVLNGAIYLVKTQVLIGKNSLYGNPTHAYVMPKERSLDIDTPHDLNFARFMMEKKETGFHKNFVCAGKQQIGPDNPCFVIAEAGVNHNGSVENAMKMVTVAAEAGADAVKFQTFSTDLMVSRQAKKADYQERETGAGESQYEMLKKLELPLDAYPKLFAECDKLGILFMSTPFDIQSVDFLDNMGMKIFKIPSGELTNEPLIRHIATKGKPVIMSTGMATLEEIQIAVSFFESNMNSNLVLLQCTSCYPTLPQDINLRAMKVLSSHFNLPVGFSDHSLGYEIALAAVSMGACVIEKHFTLDNSLDGPDHKISLMPEQLKNMVHAIRKVESALGDGEKKPVKREKDISIAARKSIHYVCDVRKGSVLKKSDLIMLRPGDGVSPSDLHLYIGEKLNRDVSAGEKLKPEDFNG